ncbi:hypothetical protein KMW28_27235 [Flammeovirga yaeyamensis]|uniref:Uncharacterized protein n=1 Tax=Flammeovirga yaeyamensis TaxID=367791 RepID=A0AAX1NDW8_9BACT|nr:hypothetical protein [Flammeovirga yaeyamensis]MBB3700025.1 hypothetical protein [Flammeovirga yaeyamensis]NMF37538.1 hypothetical protein [Flammeovirga yaeyamensis]QWG04595.1 hypothetical protein KMW28_27235 [Flammeovirga yaeyamensis]
MSYTTAVVNGEHNSEAVEVGVNLVVGAVCQVVAFKKAPKATIAVTAVGAAVNLYAAYRKGKKVQSNTSL